MKKIRNPGEYAREKENDIEYKQLDFLDLGALAFAFAFNSWLYYFLPSKIIFVPIVITIATLAIMNFSRSKIRSLGKERHAWARGVLGEERTARILENLNICPRKIYHDIQVIQLGNIDHILITEKGVFVIDTKNWDKKTIDYGIQKKHIDSLHKQIQYIKKVLQLDKHVFGVLSFPDEFIDKEKQSLGEKNEILILNPKMIATEVYPMPKAFMFPEMEEFSKKIEALYPSFPSEA